MNKKTVTIFIAALTLIVGTGAALAHLRSHQRLGRPGVKSSPVPGDVRVQVELPDQVLGYKSKSIPTDEQVLRVLPQDTSFGQKLYTGADGWQMMMNVVLMGGDRTSLHKPQFCLEGQGWHIDQEASSETTIRVDRPFPYQLPVVKLLATKEVVDANGQRHVLRGVYVYWFVADGAISASVSGYERMLWMAREMALTGVLQRWAYVTAFGVCQPGREDATFERMAELIAAAVPEFQLTPSAAKSPASVKN
jgi:hypothetical protein